MPTRSVIVWSASLACLAVLGRDRVAGARAAAQVGLDLTTLHAAALSTARAPSDSSDAPYLLVSVVGSTGQKETHELPATGHWTVRLDEAIGSTPISTLTLQPGDSLRILFTVLENGAASPQEMQVATAATAMLAERRSLLSPPAASVTPTLAPLTNGGAHWLGSASLLLTNVGGTTYWSSLDCVATCSVLRSPAAGGTGAALQRATPQPTTGVVTLTGASSTYHLQLALRRTQ